MQGFFSWVLNKFPRPWLIRLSYWVRPIIAFALQGNTFEDPIDGRKFKKMLPYGYAKTRENVLSPSTLSLERHRLLWLWLQRETDFFNRPQKLLHFAPEQAFYKRFKKMKNLNYTTTDIESPLAMVKADICDLPFEDNSFDTIFCNHVLEHISDDRKAMKEIFRVLKPNGMAVLQIPQDLNREITFEDNSITDPAERTKIFGQYDHVRVYGKDYFDTLRSIGFKVKSIDYTQQLSEEEVTRFCLAKGELLPVCFKPKL
jgi:predicted SAM-dependent methyltransferase